MGWVFIYWDEPIFIETSETEDLPEEETSKEEEDDDDE